MGDLGGRCAEILLEKFVALGLEFVGRQIGVLGHLGPGRIFPERLHLLAVHRRLEHMGRPGEFRSPLADPVNLDVIGVVVATDRVVDRDDVGLLLAKDPSEPLGRLLDIGLPEAVRIVVGRRVLHPGVLVAEKLEPADRELIGGAANSRARTSARVSPSGIMSGSASPTAPSVAHTSTMRCRAGHRSPSCRRWRSTRRRGGREEDRGRHLRDATGLAQRRDLLSGVPQIGKQFIGVLAGVSGRTLNLGVGAREARRGRGCVTPLRSTNVPRAMLCGCCGASAIDNTGAKQMSVCSMISHHSSRVFSLKRAMSSVLRSGQAERLIC